MKATVEMICGRYEVVGLRKPSVSPIAPELTDGKTVYEMTYLHSFCGKTYKTLENAIKALLKKGLEYIPNDSIITVCGWD